MKICEMFPGIQGEGVYQGAPCFFVRTSGCNLSCDFCDSKYHRDGHQYPIAEILAAIPRSLNFVDITGGEPLLQPDSLRNLASALIKRNVMVVVETNGTIEPLPDLAGTVVWSVSPKRGHVNREALKKFKEQVSYFKFVVSGADDVQYAFELIEDLQLDHVYLMPEGTDPKRQIDIAQNIAAMIASGANPCADMRVQPRLHVLLWGAKRGV